MSDDIKDLVARLFESDEASALTNEAARALERQAEEIERLRAVINDLGKPHTGHRYNTRPDICGRCRAEFVARSIREYEC